MAHEKRLAWYVLSGKRATLQDTERDKGRGTAHVELLNARERDLMQWLHIKYREKDTNSRERFFAHLWFPSRLGRAMTRV